MPEFRRGTAAIEEAVASSKGGGNFKPFVPEIFWKEDGTKRFVLILTPIDGVYGLDLHEFIKIPAEKANGESYFRYESFISRKDVNIGEDYDKIEDEFGRKPKTRILGVGVELIPVMETIKGRQRPTGFTVQTDEFKRNTDDGEEMVTYPVIGIISQSSQLMWTPLKGMDESAQGPLEDLPLEITRKIPGGQASNTYYEFIPFQGVDVDLSAVAEYVDGVSYLTDQLEELVPEMEACEDDMSVAQTVARYLLDKRVAELADRGRYEELVGPLEELEPLPWESKSKGKAAPAKKAAPARPARPSRRVKKEEPEAPEEISSEETPKADAKQAKFDRLKKRLEPKE
jgi:hypothetical protein